MLHSPNGCVRCMKISLHFHPSFNSDNFDSLIFYPAENRSFPSLTRVSTKNRSLHGTNPQSRGESSLELEAVAAVHELSFAVQTISVSEILPRTPDLIFVNVTTVEGQPYCLELTLKGWRVTSLRHDCMHGDYTRLDLFTVYYDTLYDLMDKLSPNYRNLFSEKLAQKLRMLQAAEDDDRTTSAPFSTAATQSKNFTDNLVTETPICYMTSAGNSQTNNIISHDDDDDDVISHDNDDVISEKDDNS